MRVHVHSPKALAAYSISLVPKKKSASDHTNMSFHFQTLLPNR